MNRLSRRQNQIHGEIVSLIEKQRRIEWRIIQLLQEAEEADLPRAFECRSLFMYATRILKLDDDRAYPLITLARKSRILPEFAAALYEGKLSFSKASRIVSIIDSENAEELIAFAITHSKREVEFEVARRNPRGSIERVTPISEDRIELTISLSKTDYEKLLRVQSLEARGNPLVSRGEAVTASLNAYLNRHDPVVKAERSIQRSQARAEKTNSQKLTIVEQETELSRKAEAMDSNGKPRSSRDGQSQVGKTLCPGRVNRKPLTSAERHAAHFLTRGKCMHIYPDGSRCNEDRYTDLHHIIEVSRGGSNHSGNLTTLCRFHHQLLHKKSQEVPSFEDWIEQCRPTEVYF